MANVEMFMDDPEKRVLLGMPEVSKRKVINPFYEATELDKEGKRKEAERIYLELLNNDFDNSVIMAALGMNYAVAEKNGLANLLLLKALEGCENGKMMDDFQRVGIIPKSDNPDGLSTFKKIKRSELLNAIGTTFKHENRTTLARKYFEDAQEGLPVNPDIQNNLGTLYINEGHPEKARAHLNAALGAQPDHAQAHWNLSLVHLELGEYAQGWSEYHWGLAAKVRVDRNYSREPLPMWDGSPGKTVIVYGEQGIGDEIMFASCLTELMASSKKVIFECHKKLHTLFANSFPTLDIYPTREDEIITWPLRGDGSKRYDVDCKIPIGDLPRFYRPDINAFPGTPFLSPTPAAELTWSERLASLGTGPKIGISWAGGHKRTRIEVRSMELAQLLPILQQKGATFVSLQYTPCEDEIARLEKEHGIKIHHWPEACYSANYDDTAGLVAGMDLVITVCTSLVHLAGSMGVPTWVMVPSRPAWRYRLDLETMPWYKTVTLFRQQPDTQNWEPVIAEVAENLTSLLLGATNGQQNR